MTKTLFNEGVINEPNNQITDSVIVELHSATPPHTLVYSVKCIVNTNGQINCIINSSFINNYSSFVISHRNALSTWSAVPVYVLPGMVYNFQAIRLRLMVIIRKTYLVMEVYGHCTIQT